MGRRPQITWIAVAAACLLQWAQADIAACTAALEETANSEARVALLNQATATVSSAAARALGNAYAADLGNYDACMSLHGAHHCLAGSVKKSDRLLGASPLSGICAPVECHETELEDPATLAFIQESMLELLQNSTRLHTTAGQQQLQYFANLNATLAITQASELGFTCGSHRAAMTAGRHICYSLVWGLIFFVMVATLYDLGSAPGSSAESESSETSSALQDCMDSWTKAFSLIRNIRYMAVHRGDEAFAFLHGMRVLSITWIILGQTFVVQASLGYLNPAEVFPPTGFIRRMAAQVFMSSWFAVDTFFVIGGFLTMHKILTTLDPPHYQAIGATDRRLGDPLTASASAPSSGSGRWWAFFYLHRLARILPIYVFCLLLWWKVGLLLGSGPFWYRWLAYSQRCDSYWWTNLLFINNLFPYNAAETSECMHHSWYLANDAQFYVVTPLFFLLYLRNRKYGWAVTIAALLASCTVAVACSVVYEWSAHQFDGVWTTNYARGFYTKPQFRVSPYLIGIMGALLWHHKLKNYRTFKFSRLYAGTINTLAVALIGFVTFIGASAYQQRPCDDSEDPGSSNCGSGWLLGSIAAYNSLTRPVWGLAVITLILMCMNKQAGPLDHFLSHRMWAIPAKVTFAAYLLHPLVINVWLLSRTQKARWNTIDFAMAQVGIVVVIFAVAFIAAMLVELPCLRIWKAIHARYGERQETEEATEHTFVLGPLSTVELPTTQRTPHASYGAVRSGESTALLSGNQSRSQHRHEFRGQPRRIGDS